MDKNKAAKMPGLDRHFAYCIYEQCWSKLKKYESSDMNFGLLY